MLDLLTYRFYRQRRVIALGLIPTLGTLWLLWLHAGPLHPSLIALGIALPTLHALRYPNNWTETLVVSLSTAACLGLATTIPPGMETGAFAIRVFWLVFLWFVLFFVLAVPVSMLASIGPVSTGPVRSSVCSRLDAETLRRATTMYPGREDLCFTCGEADEEGRFPVTLRLEFGVLTCNDGPTPEMDEIGMSEDGVLECEGSAVIHSSGPDHHEVFFFDASSDAVTASKHSFVDLGKRGTRVILEEAGTPLSVGERFGMWVSDYMADYLTSQIDVAEGRAPRANRAFRHRQLVVDLANILVPILNAQGLPPPDDEDAENYPRN